MRIAEAAVLPTKEMADNWFPWHGPYKALVTTGSLSIENGAATPDPHVALLVQRYMADADEIIMIADHTKFYSKATATITMCGLAPEKTDWLSEEKKFRLITDVNWDYEVEAEEYRKLVKIIEPLTPTDEEFSSLRIFESVLVPKLQDTKR